MFNEWNEKVSRNIAMSLLKAVSGEDVKKIMDANKNFFHDENNWHSYGNNPDNWGTANAQQSNSVGALLEIIMNGLDAVLIKKYNQQKGDEPGNKPPEDYDMYRAIKDFFEVREGKINNLEKRPLGKLADEVVQVGIKRATGSLTYPTYTVVDFGEGQSPDNFLNSFLSISHGNKKGYSFVQGKYNQGSMGSILHCTRGKTKRGGYKFILSKKVGTKEWGWTLIKIKPADKTHRNPEVVYFAIEKKEATARFTQDESINAFNQEDHSGQVQQGTIVKLYEYAIGEGAHKKEEGLRYALTQKLITCPLPFRILDFDGWKSTGAGQLSVDRQKGIYSTVFSGLKNMLEFYTPRPGDKQEQNKERRFISLGEHGSKDLGNVRIEGYPKLEMPEYVTKSNKVVFYTVNGQTHATQSGGILNRCDLGELTGHLVVNVICDDLDKNLTLFKTDRERMNRGDDEIKIKEIVKEKLKASEELKDFQKEVAALHSREREEDSEYQKQLWRNIFSNMYAAGEDLPPGTRKPAPIDEDYEGKEFPTFIKFEFKKHREKDIEVPINKKRKIPFLCDARNDYLTREQQSGRIYFFDDNKGIEYSPSELRNGNISLTISKGEDTQVGDVVKCVFGFDDVSKVEPLICEFTIKFTKEETSNRPSVNRKKESEHQDDDNTKQIPNVDWVEENDINWRTYNFNQETGAVVVKGEDLLTIYVNKENRHLKYFLDKAKNRADVEDIFKFGTAGLTLALYEKVEKTEDADIVYSLGSPAVARVIVPLVEGLLNMKSNSRKRQETTEDEQTEPDKDLLT